MSRLLITPHSSPFLYIAVFALLCILELIYFRIARKYNIIDKPNNRSSHSKVTLQGGGVIFCLAALLYLSLNFSLQALWFFAGFTLIAAVSFTDDLIALPARQRLAVHFISITFSFVAAHIAAEFFNIYPWWAVIISYIVFVGIINVYNFMDGINGITSLYSIAVLLSLQYVNLFMHPFVNPDLIWFPIIACLILLFFNFRKHAKCFPGDVGSISIAFWIVTLLLIVIIKTNNIIWLGFLMVYGVDGVGTIIHRIYLGENITRPHRIHLFQILSNERGMSQRIVSLFYFIAQIIVSTLIIWLYPIVGWWVFVVILVALMTGYIWKFKLMKEHGLRVLRNEPPTTVYSK